ncbi:MAG: tetratricopeptide repeat protein [Gammaproteobacteria bacterium]|nr:tetratricopeptide repeat protein [Gammaproteobacteria bacterium]
MDIYASDDEKGEEIKQWWRDNGLAVAVACVLVIAGIIGGRYWIAHNATQTEMASLRYQAVVNAIAQDDSETAEDTTTQLLSEFTKTPYAVFSAFEMVKYSASNDDLTSSKTYLNWIIEHAKLSGQIDVARMRLAQILLSEKQYQEAIILTQQSDSSAFASLFSELRGDIYVAQDQKQEARVAYQTALSTLAQGEPRQQVLQLKLDDVAGGHDS